MTGYRRAPRPLASSLRALESAWEPQSLLAETQRIWPEVVGPEIAAEATPASERGGLLSVRCSASVWAQELELMAPDILGALNARLHRGQLLRIRCQIA